MMRVIRLVAAVGGAATILGLAACGGDRAVPVETIVERDNAICTTYAQQIDKIATPAFDPGQATRANLPAVASYLDQVVPLLDAERRQIESAGRPDASQSLHASVLATLAAVIRDEQAARSAAHSADLREFQAAYRTDRADSTHLAGTAQQFGLTACIAR